MEQKDFISRFTSFLPIVTLMALMYGVIKQFIYYYYFNLDIFPYLEISELLPQTIFDLLLSIAYFGITLSFITTTWRSFRGLDVLSSIFLSAKEIEDAILLDNTKKSAIHLFNTDVKILIVITLVSFGISCFELYLIVQTNPLDTNFMPLKTTFYLFLSLSITTGFFIFLTLIKKVKDEMVHLVASMMVFLILSGVLEGHLKYKRVCDLHVHDGYSITINDVPITSNREFYYIGKTKSTVFFYNTKNNLVTSYPTSSITKMEIGSD